MTSPYRAAPMSPNPKVTFGNARKAMWLRAVALLVLVFGAGALSLWLGGAPASWFAWVGPIKVFVVVPLLVAGLLLRRATWGGLELRRDTGELIVIWRRVGPRKERRLSVAELTGVTIEATSRDERERHYELRLNLTNARHVLLLRANTAEALEPSRARVGEFVLEHGLLARGDSPAPARIAAPAASEIHASEANGTDDAEGAVDARRSRSS